MIKKLLGDKNTIVMIIGVIIGCGFIVYGNINTTEPQTLSDDITYTSDSLETYTEQLEEKIASFLEKIEGVSDVSCIVTIENGSENVYAVEGDNKDYVIMTDAKGNQSAIKITEITAKIRGIAIICNYSTDEQRHQILEMLSSLYSVGLNRISIMRA